MTIGFLVANLKLSTSQFLRDNSKKVVQGKKTMVQQMTELDQELSRLESEYSWRNSGNIPADRYSYFNEAALLHSQSLERNLLTLLKRDGVTSLHEKKILDVA